MAEGKDVKQKLPTIRGAYDSPRGSRIELDESKTDPAEKETPKKESAPKEQRRISVRNSKFFLFKKISENGDLSPIGSYETEPEIREAYEKTLDKDVPQKDIRGFKGRPLVFKVTETKRRIRVK